MGYVTVVRLAWRCKLELLLPLGLRAADVFMLNLRSFEQIWRSRRRPFSPPRLLADLSCWGRA